MIDVNQPKQFKFKQPKRYKYTLDEKFLDILKKHNIHIFNFEACEDDGFFLMTAHNQEPEELMKELWDANISTKHYQSLTWERLPSFEQLPLFKSDAINHPSHYASGKIEVIEAIEDWKLGFNRGNCVKYVARAGKKDPTKEVEDLKKAVWYLNREIEIITAQTEGRERLRPNEMNKGAR